MNYFNYPNGYGITPDYDYYLRQMHGGGQHGNPPSQHGGGQHGTPPPQHGGGHQPPPHGGDLHHGFPPPPHGGGQFHHGGPPTAPPPIWVPHEQVGVHAVDPGGIRHCLYRYTYVWLTNGRSFWYYPTYVGPTSIAGYRWRGHQWDYYGMDLRRIRSFSCH